MKRGKNDKVTSLNDHLRYSGNKMSNRERNEFERKLQKDPFASEAAEGFDSISPENASADIDFLKSQVEKRSNYKKFRPLTLYRIAASVAILLAVSSLVFLLTRGPEIKVTTIAQNEPLMEQGTSEDSMPAQIALASPPADKPKVFVEKPAKEVSEPDEIIINAIETQNVPEIEVLDAKDETKALTTVTQTDISAALSGRVAGVAIQQPSVSTENAKKSRAAAEKSDELFFADDSGLAALEEVVVVGYGVARSGEYEAGAVAEIDNSYISATPSTGSENFRKYIETNIKIPASMKIGEREVVILSVTVDGLGKIKNIKPVRSPGEEFTFEAKRLIMTGPAWKPATQNGDTITDDVRLRIIFKL